MIGVGNNLDNTGPSHERVGRRRYLSKTLIAEDKLDWSKATFQLRIGGKCLERIFDALVVPLWCAKAKASGKYKGQNHRWPTLRVERRN